MNAVKARDPQGTYTVPIVKTDTRLFTRHTDDTVRALLADLRRQSLTLPSSRLEALETLWGWTYNMHGIMADPDNLYIKPISQTMFDWMHIYLVDGVWNTEVFFLLVMIRRAGFSIIFLTDFMGRWYFPKRLSDSARDRCSTKELTKMFDLGDHFKCSASEGLSLYPLFAIFLNVYIVPDGLCQEQVDSYMALADVLDLLQSCRYGLVSSNRLEEAIQKHLFLFTKAYENLGVKPKHHYSIHLPEQLERFGTLIGSTRNTHIPKHFMEHESEASHIFHD